MDQLGKAPRETKCLQIVSAVLHLSGKLEELEVLVSRLRGEPAPQPVTDEDITALGPLLDYLPSKIKVMTERVLKITGDLAEMAGE
jgi:hypothetical protein